jgi:hypothetical protein
MTETDFHRELVCGRNLLSSDPVSQLMSYQALERCKNYLVDNPNPDLESLLPAGWRKIPKEIQHA